MKAKTPPVRQSVTPVNAQQQAATGEKNIDIDKILARQGKVAVTWSIKDVQRLRPDLTISEAWDVLLEAKHKHETGWGCSCSHIEDIAEYLFPKHYHDDD